MKQKTRAFVILLFAGLLAWLCISYWPYFSGEQTVKVKLGSLVEQSIAQQQTKLDTLFGQLYQGSLSANQLYASLDEDDQLYVFENNTLRFWPPNPKLDGLVSARFTDAQLFPARFDRPLLVVSRKKQLGELSVTLIQAQRISPFQSFFRPVWHALSSVQAIRDGKLVVDNDLFNLNLIEVQRIFYTLLYLWFFLLHLCLGSLHAWQTKNPSFLLLITSGFKVVNAFVYPSLAKQIWLFDPKIFAFNFYLNSLFDLMLMVFMGICFVLVFFKRSRSGFVYWLSTYRGIRGLIISALLAGLLYFLVELQVQVLRSIYDFSHIRTFDSYFAENGLLLVFLAFLLFFKFAILGFSARYLFVRSWKDKALFFGLFMALLFGLGVAFHLGLQYMAFTTPLVLLVLLPDFGRTFRRFQYRAYIYFLSYLIAAVLGLFASFRAIGVGAESYFSKLETQIQLGKDLSQFQAKELAAKLGTSEQIDSLFIAQSENLIEASNRKHDNLYKLSFQSDGWASAEQANGEPVFNRFQVRVFAPSGKLLGRLQAEFGLPSLINLVVQDVEPGSEFAISKKGNIVFSTGSAEFNELAGQADPKVNFKRLIRQNENYEMISYHLGNRFYFHYASRKPDPTDLFVIGLVFVSTVFGFFILAVMLVKFFFRFSWSSLPFLFRIQSFLNLSFFLPVLAIFLVFQVVFYPNLKKLVYVFVVSYFTNQNMGGSEQFVGFTADYDRNGRIMNSSYSGKVFPSLMPFDEHYRLWFLNDGKPSLHNATNCIFIKQCENNKCSTKAFSIFFLLPTIDGFYNNYYKIILITICSVFLVFVFFNYSVSQTIVLPFNRFSGMLKSISLNNLKFINEKVTDEFDRIFKVFNKLIFKIQEDKRKLETTERELAWKDVARQVAHEVKNPLTPLRLNLQMMEQRLRKSGLEDKENIIRYFPGLYQQIDVLDNLATEFSSFSRLPVPQKERFNMVDFLQGQIRFFNETNHTEILLHTQLEQLELNSDPKMIGRAITNLMLNAIQSGQHVQVRVHLTLGEGRIRLSIEDNGPGIAEELQSKIFTLFFTTKSGGSGIGLAMMKRDMEALGGRVWFETETSKGTRFEIELPLA